MLRTRRTTVGVTVLENAFSLCSGSDELTYVNVSSDVGVGMSLRMSWTELCFEYNLILFFSPRIGVRIENFPLLP